MVPVFYADVVDDYELVADKCEVPFYELVLDSVAGAKAVGFLVLTSFH